MLKNIVDDIEANIVYYDNEKCDLFNTYFSCISGIDDENVLLPDFESRTGSSISDIVCTEEEIFDVITNLAVNKASGPDIISHTMLQVSPEEIAVPLRIIFNKFNSANILNHGKKPMLYPFLRMVIILIRQIIAQFRLYRDAIPCRTLLKNHKRQNNSFPFSLVNLKLNYTFEEVDGQLNVLVSYLKI
jgi:hypothetical protein